MNCVAVCEAHSLAFGLSGYVTAEASGPSLRRRNILAGVAAGAALVPAVRTGVIQSVEGTSETLGSWTAPRGSTQS